MFASLTGSDLRYCSVSVDAGGGFHVLDGLKGGWCDLCCPVRL